ncbi:MAG: hypothetical protein R8L53_04040, partial [Mariprofundales bacterium]
MLNNNWSLCVLYIIILTVLSACSLHQPFRAHWWSYYERGVQQLNKTQPVYDNISNDFIAAIAERNQDARHAKTYGMHFIDYFPQRELGIVYFQQGKNQQAQQYLKASIASWPTSRAYHYLDAVRQKLLQQNNSDAHPPNLYFENSLPKVSNALGITLVGNAYDDSYVAAVRINGERIWQPHAQLQLHFSHYLPLHLGDNSIHVQVVDLLGNRSDNIWHIFVDRDAPQLGFDDIQLFNSGKQIRLRGSVLDEQAAPILRINDKIISLADDGSFSIDISPNDMHILNINTQDGIGNNMQQSIHISQ